MHPGIVGSAVGVAASDQPMQHSLLAMNLQSCTESDGTILICHGEGD